MRKLVFLLVVVLLAGCSSNKESVKEETKQIETSNPSGKAGNNITWEIKGHTLTFRGKGATFNYKANENEWDLNHRNEFDNVVFEEGITGIGSFFFDNNINVKHIKFPSTLKRIEDNAFCIYDLDDLILPDNLEYLGIIPEIEGLFVKRVTIPVKLKEIGSEVCLRAEKGSMDYIYFKGYGVNEDLFDKEFRHFVWGEKEVRYDDPYFEKYIDEYKNIKFIKMTSDTNETAPISNEINTFDTIKDKVLINDKGVKFTIKEVESPFADQLTCIMFDVENKNNYKINYQVDYVLNGLRIHSLALGDVEPHKTISDNTSARYNDEFLNLKFDYKDYEIMVEINKYEDEDTLTYLCSNTLKSDVETYKVNRDISNDKVLLENEDVIITDTGKTDISGMPLMYVKNKSNKVIHIKNKAKSVKLNGEKASISFYVTLKPNECEIKNIYLLKKYRELEKIDIEMPIEEIEYDNYGYSEPKEISRSDIGTLNMNIK